MKEEIKDKILKLTRWIEETIKKAPAPTRKSKIEWLEKNNPDFIKANEILAKFIAHREKVSKTIDQEISDMESEWDKVDSTGDITKQRELEKQLQKLRQTKRGLK